MIIYFTNHTTLREVLYLIIFKIKTSLYVYFYQLPGWYRCMKTGKKSRKISSPHSQETGGPFERWKDAIQRGLPGVASRVE